MSFSSYMFAGVRKAGKILHVPFLQLAGVTSSSNTAATARYSSKTAESGSWLGWVFIAGLAAAAWWFFFKRKGTRSAKLKW